MKEILLKIIFMYLLSVNLYELGQFLQILLWISLPMIIIVLLVTTYLHYRKKRRQRPEEEFAAGYPAEMELSAENGISYENSTSPNGITLENSIILKNSTTLENKNNGSPDNSVSPENNANAYKGLLWMKDKYEQYREQTDYKYEKLKEELARSEQKYLNLLAERAEQKAIILPASGSVKSPLPAAGPTASLQAAAPIGEAFTEENLSDKSTLQSSSYESLLPDKPIITDESSSDESLLPANSFAQETVPEAPSIPDLVFEKERQIGFLHVELDQRIKNYYELEYQNREDKARAEELAAQYLQAQQLLEAQQLKIDELNARLGHEMGKVVDLTGKLESNMRLLLHIHQELDNSLHVQQPDRSLPVQNEGAPYEGAMPEAEENEQGNGASLPLAKQSHEPGRDHLLPLTENTKIVGWIESEEAGINTP